MSLLSKINIVVAFLLLLCSVSIAENEKNKSLCDICQCSTSEVKCNSVVDADLLLTFDGNDIERLSISNSELGNVRKEHFSQFRNISIVLLNSNKLIIDSSSFSLLTAITTLNLNNNSIEDFTPGVFENNVKLVNLSLNGNQIRYIANNAFKNLHNLSRLFLINNSIENMASGAFVGLSSLEELHLGGNQLQRVSARAFSPLARLRALSLRDNLLEEVEEGAWSGLEATLEELDLGGNRLLRADAAFAPLRALRVLRVLRLERNRIASFGPALVEALAQRPGLSAQLQPNPLRCACGELRDAWTAASARGLRMSLLCDDGRPWDAAMRSLKCGSNEEAERDTTIASALLTEKSLVSQTYVPYTDDILVFSTPYFSENAVTLTQEGVFSQKNESENNFSTTLSDNFASSTQNAEFNRMFIYSKDSSENIDIDIEFLLVFLVCVVAVGLSVAFAVTFVQCLKYRKLFLPLTEDV